MLTVIIVLLVAAAVATFFLMKKGKVAEDGTVAADAVANLYWDLIRRFFGIENLYLVLIPICRYQYHYLRPCPSILDFLEM